MKKVSLIVLILLPFLIGITACDKADLPEYILSYEGNPRVFSLEMNGKTYRELPVAKWLPMETYETEPIGICWYDGWKTYIYKTSSPDCVYVKSSRKNLRPQEWLFTDGVSPDTINYNEVSKASFRQWEHSKKNDELIEISFWDVLNLLERGEKERYRSFDMLSTGRIELYSDNKPGLKAWITVYYNRENNQHYLYVSTIENAVFECINCELLYQMWTGGIE